MSNRGWLWKKKRSEKVVAAASAAIENLSESKHLEEETKVKYVQITEESYLHLGDLEEEVKLLNEKLSSALLEISNKDTLVKQHAKVAEDAVSGWEKAEAEAISLKSELESLMLQKLTVEEKAAHLDRALKECLREVRIVKEEGEEKLRDVVFAKTSQWEKTKEDLEARIDELNQGLLKETAENNALSRSLHERANLLMKISEEKSQVDAQVEVLKSNLQSCDKEINSLKYELHVVTKELEIRNEEKNMSLKSAEVASKQHLEGVKKITKLEAECQRLRGLVRKKLPGPAALAQMRLEVEGLGRDYGESRLRKSPAKNPNLHSFSPTDPCSPLKKSLQYPISPVETSLDADIRSKENEFLTSRLTTMEEEMKMLKEALWKRNSELQASRNLYSKTASKLQSLEARVQSFNQDQNTGKINLAIPLEFSVLPNASNPPSLSSLSEDGNDEVASVADSTFTITCSDVSQLKEKHRDKSSKNGSSNHLELMDDFLEMEKLANLSLESNGSEQIIGHGCVTKENGEALYHSSSENHLSAKTAKTHLERLQSKIALAFENQVKDSDCNIVLEQIRRAVQDIQEDLHQNSDTCAFEKIMDSECTLPADAKSCIERKNSIDRKLENAIFEIREFFALLRKEATEVEGCKNADFGIIQKIDELFITIDKISSSQISLADFVVDLSFILTTACKFGLNSIGVHCNQGEGMSSDYVDKVPLLENGVQYDQAKGTSTGKCSPAMVDTDLNGESPSHKVEEFVQLKEQWDSMLVDLARSNECVEQKKLQLEEKDKLLSELKSQLTASQKSNSLNETQLKCMTESYRTLEARSGELEAEIHILRRRAENLDIELQEAKFCRDDASAKCKDLELKCRDLEVKCKDLETSCMVYQTRLKELEEQIERCENGSAGTVTPDPNQLKQESEIAAAAEKLAECQETIFLLSKQLETMRSPSSPISPGNIEKLQLRNNPEKGDSPSRGRLNLRTVLSQDFDQLAFENVDYTIQRYGSSAPLSPVGAPMSPKSGTVVSTLQSTHIPTRSSSSASLAQEKQGHGISRFFSK